MYNTFVLSVLKKKFVAYNYKQLKQEMERLQENIKMKNKL